MAWLVSVGGTWAVGYPGFVSNTLALRLGFGAIRSQNR